MVGSFVLQHSPMKTILGQCKPIDKKALILSEEQQDKLNRLLDDK